MTMETKTCKNCSANFTITPDDVAFYEKIKVPAPTWCPECRLKRRLAQRNERSLYKRTCDLCGASIIAMYSPNKPYKVYCPPCWYSDKWEALDYGRDYDLNRPFFDQLKDLQIAVPQISLLVENVVDSPWVNYEVDAKNCYLNFGGGNNEDGAYNHYNLKTKDSFDNFWFMRGEYGYENILCENSYKTFYSIFSYDCRDTYASFDCRNCSNVIGCTGLRHKQYHIFNQPVSKEDYEKFATEYLSGSYQKLQELLKKSHEFWKTKPQRAIFVEKSANALGHIISESRNVSDALSIEKTENSKHVLYTLQVKDSYDTSSVWQGELLYEFLGGYKVSNSKCCTGILNDASELEYSHLLIGSNHCFGSMNLRSKSYCILNKQYSKEEYATLKAKIIGNMKSRGEYGEFFPPSFSMFSYDETIAHEWFPMKKEEAISGGWNWDEHESTQYEFSDYHIPDSIQDVGDDILQQTLKCEQSGKAYRIIPMELAFYRRFGIPIPRRAPFPRHHQRLSFISQHRTLRPRTCGNCHQSIESVYSEEEFPIVYCEACYQKEIV